MNFFNIGERTKEDTQFSKNTEENKFLIIGGDLRNYELAKLLAKEKNIVYTYGLEEVLNTNLEKENSFECNKIEEVLEKAEIIIMPIPLTKDGIHLNMPLSNKKIKIEFLINKIRNKIVFAGDVSETLLKKFEDNNTKVIDLMKIEGFAILNVLPTVEAIIKIILNNKKEIIHNSNCLILGYGRIGKILAQKLQGLSINVTCVTNDNIEKTWCMAFGYKAIDFKDIENNGTILRKYDIIINTIPKIILTKELEKVRKETLIIDVASKPFGIARKIVEEQKLNFIEALGLPGKHFPITVAKNIKDVVFNILQKQ